MPQANRMNRDQSDIINNETTTLNNGITVNNGAAADNSTRIPVPHGLDDLEVQEWLESLDSVLESSGPEVATEILERLRAHATVSGIDLPFSANTPYANTIPARLEPLFPGDQELERRIKSLIRWNALAMVVARQPRRAQYRRPHFHLRKRRHALRSRLQSFLSRPHARVRR